jgi:methyltransferase, FkbM family
MKLVNNSEKLNDLILAQQKSGILCEKLLGKIYQSYLKPKDTFIDVGASLGHHFFPMSKIVGRKGKGLGIEANHQMAESLIEKIKTSKRKNLEIVSFAAAENQGETDFFTMGEFPGWSSLYEQHVHPKETQKPQKVTVKLETIDNIIKDLGWTDCHFIKLDIEHAEFPALRGAKNTLKTFKPIVVFENSPRAAASLNDYSADDFFDFFVSIDYEIYDIFLNKFTIERWMDKEKLLPSYYIAVPAHNKFFEGKRFLKQYDRFLQKTLKNN